MNCNTSVWPSESLHCGKRDPIRPWKRVLMNGERALPFGPMLSYIYIPNSKPYTRIVLPHRERYRCFRFLFSPFFSFFFLSLRWPFNLPPTRSNNFRVAPVLLVILPLVYSLSSTIPRKFHSQPLNHSHLEILNYRIISRERIQKLSNPIDYAYSSKGCSTVKKKKERKKKTRRDGHEGVELYSTSLPRERGKARGPFARLFGKGKRRSRERGNAWGDWRSKRRGEVL